MPHPSIDGVPLLHADDDLLVVDKPAGLLAVPGRGEDKQDCLSRRVQAVFPEALVVHRLDMATSGLMLMARHPAAQRALGLAFEERRVDKRYMAVVAQAPSIGEHAVHATTPEGGPLDADGAVAADDGWSLIDLPIAVDWPRRPLRIIDRAGGKPSLTRWRLQGRDAATGGVRLDLAPVTGRSHQLRVHLQAVGSPILGDALYAPPELQARAPRLLLHAAQLVLRHPASGIELLFDSAAPF